MKFARDNKSDNFQENDNDRRRSLISGKALSLDIISVLAGDRDMLPADIQNIEIIKKNLGPRLYSDILYTITHQYFPIETAQQLWEETLRHKINLSRTLKRNIKIVVAVLDYLSNVTGDIQVTTLISESHIKEIISNSMRDGMTGLFNHTYFFEQIQFETGRCLRYRTPVSLILIDIDDFKVVNDTYGHQEGDRIISTMGQRLAHIARSTDIGCRYGGEEFALILPSTSINESIDIATKLLSVLSEKTCSGEPVTVSIGVSTCNDKTDTYQKFVINADLALYQAKKNGKNQVVAYKQDITT